MSQRAANAGSTLTVNVRQRLRWWVSAKTCSISGQAQRELGVKRMPGLR